MAAAQPQVFFLPVGDGQRLCIFHPPQGAAPRGRVLYLHPFAEEMNASRRMAAATARAMAADGWAVLQIDLLGCGDSSGVLEDATWKAWVQDGVVAAQWLSQQPLPSEGPLWLWGLRTGALLAGHVAEQLPTPAHLLLWQGAAKGQTLLQPWLRLATVAQMMGQATGQRSAAQRLAEGETVYLGGYPVTPFLAEGLGRAQLHPPSHGKAGRLVWLEVGDTTPPAAARAVQPFEAAGWRVHQQAVAGPPFWQVVTGETAPALIEASVQALREDTPC